MPDESRQRSTGSDTARTATSFCHQETELDRDRNFFRAAFSRYSQEGRRMKDLLMASDDSAEPERTLTIHKQQLRLNEAQQSYELARARYVRRVLASFIAPEHH